MKKWINLVSKLRIKEIVNYIQSFFLAEEKPSSSLPDQVSEQQRQFNAIESSVLDMREFENASIVFGKCRIHHNKEKFAHVSKGKLHEKVGWQFAIIWKNTISFYEKGQISCN